MKTTNSVSWKSYAHQYDMLLKYNPYYQSLHKEVLNAAQQWSINPGDQIADIGAGTGNYSLSLAQMFPHAELYHIDRDEGMNQVTLEKQTANQINNHHLLEKGIGEVELKEESFQALVSIHALYTFPNPDGALEKMYKWLKPGGYAILVDAGRVINILGWQVAVGWKMIQEYGVKKTLEIFRQGKEVSKQNAYIRNMQLNGTFWTHSHEDFCKVVKSNGFEIIENHVTFRGVSDFVVAKKR